MLTYRYVHIICHWFGTYLQAFGGTQIPILAATALIYGFAIIVFAYISSFLFSKHTTAQTYTLLLCTLGVTILQGISFALSYPTLNVVQWGQDLFNYIALLFPPYAFATALTNLAYKTQCPEGIPEDVCKRVRVFSFCLPSPPFRRMVS